MAIDNERSGSKIKSSVFLYGTVLAVVFTMYFIFMGAAGLVHITELRLLNYVILFFVCFYQLKKLFNNGKNNVSYLQGFGTVFFTGIWSYLLFAVFLYFYVEMMDDRLQELFWESIPIEFSYFLPWPYITIFFEGSAVSIIMALMLMQYYRKYEEGEDKLFHTFSKKPNLSKR